MNLIEYINEIFDIAVANNMPWDVGADMFLANIRNAGQEGLPYYAGAEIDYFALQGALFCMTAQEVADMKNEFNEFVRAHIGEIIEARKK